MSFSIAYSQTINFDNYVSATNNDLVNNFDGMHNLTQIPNNGITGGCVSTPLTMPSASFAANLTKYKWTYTQANPFKASICFKYISALDPKLSQYRSSKISLVQYDSTNGGLTLENVTSACDYEQIEISYFVASSSGNYFPALTYLSDQWYKLELVTYYHNQTLFATSNLYSIGTNGLATPTLFATISRNDTSKHFPEDLGVYYRVQFTGYNKGGAQYLDNMNISAVPSSTNLIDMGKDFAITCNNNLISIDNLLSRKYSLIIYNSIGQQVFKTESNEAFSKIDISSFRNGMYFVELQSEGKRVKMEKVIRG